MNKKIQNILKNEINDFKTFASYNTTSNSAIFNIMDTLFNGLNSNKELQKKSGLELITPLTSNNVVTTTVDIMYESTNQGGVGFLFKFDGELYSIKFIRYIEQDEMVHYINVVSKSTVSYKGSYIFKYVLYSALDVSKLKGSYFTMPRKQFSWDIKTLEPRTFDDIFLPKDIMEDLHLFVDIYDKSNKILRYLKVGNPGVGKTESTIILSNELNKKGVTIIKTPICELLHEKVELANLLAPSLLVFDDIDLYLGNRNGQGYSALLGDFLDVLDGTDKLSDDVGIIATTNAAHLLDLAAQRPGRFDKTLLYDDITKDNINKIIRKSLKLNFDITTSEELEPFVDKRIIDKFYDAGVSGAHVFNSMKMLKLRYDTLEIDNITTDDIVDSIEAELKVIDKIRKSSELKSNYERNKSDSMGFRTNSSNEFVVEEDAPEIEIEPTRPRRKRKGFV